MRRYFQKNETQSQEYLPRKKTGAHHLSRAQEQKNRRVEEQKSRRAEERKSKRAKEQKRLDTTETGKTHMLNRIKTKGFTHCTWGWTESIQEMPQDDRHLTILRSCLLRIHGEKLARVTCATFGNWPKALTSQCLFSTRLTRALPSAQLHLFTSFVN